MSADQINNEIDKLDQPLPLWFLIILPFYAGGFLALLLLLPAGDWRWLEAWLVIISFAVITSVSYTIINKRNPRVLRNRMKTKREGLSGSKEKTGIQDMLVMLLLGSGFFGFMVLAGLDHRFDWSRMSFALEMSGLVLVNIGYGIMNLSMLQNAFASKILDINQEQQLIDTGLYAQVRHPLYAGALCWLVFMPLALGSWWALIPAVVGVISLVVRIEIEEDMLVVGMDGYEDYQQKVKYKLIPGVY